MVKSIVLACFGLLFGSIALADDSGGLMGPISIRNSRPYNLLFMQFRPELPDVLQQGHTRTTAQLDLINNMLAPANFGQIKVLEDNEIDRIALSWSKGMGQKSEFSVFIPLLYRNGGVLDQLMNSWHKFFDIPAAEDDPAGRNSFSPYQSNLFLSNASGKVIVNQGNAFGVGDISMTWKRSLINTQRAGVGARVALKLPTGNPGLLLGSGATDIGADIDVRYKLGRDFNWFANIGYVLTSGTSPVPNTRKHMTQYLFGAELVMNHQDSYIAQIDGNSIAVWTGHPLADRAPVTATFGYKRRVTERLILSLAFSENGDYHSYSIPTLGNIGPDFTTTVGFEWRH